MLRKVLPNFTKFHRFHRWNLEAPCVTSVNHQYRIAVVPKTHFAYPPGLKFFKDGNASFFFIQLILRVVISNRLLYASNVIL